MTVKELRRLLDKIEDDTTIVVTTNHKFNDEEEGALVEVVMADYLHGEYVEAYTGDKIINDLFVIY